MKRLYIFLVLACIASLPMMAERVPQETARKVAITFLNNNGAKSAQLTDLTKAAGFANLYIFTAEQGFVVMAADDCVQPILGYSLTEKFVVEGMPENLRWWLRGYDDQIADAVANKSEASAKASKQWIELKAGAQRASKSDVIVGPLIQTKWDQDKYYNRLCPAASGGPDGHVYTGCVATAMAQLMKYWNYPTTGSGSHSYTHGTYGEQSVDFGETTYDWANMPNTLNSNSTSVQINAVAKLMYHCGVSVDMNYGTGSSGAPSYKVQNALINYFNYSPFATFVSQSSFSDDQWIAFLKSELDESRPLFYSGSNLNSGHAFICDGYRSDDHFHFNWGWSGYDGSYGSSHGNNGYWAIGSLSPGAGGSGSGSGTYNMNNAVMAWVEPVSDFTAPTLSATEEDGNIHLTWNSVSGATSYDIYKDNAKVASVSTCEYTDNEVYFGTSYMYYVRAIASTDTSNPSNLINIMVKQRDRIPSNLALSVSEVDNSIHLAWDVPETQSASLHYGLGQIGSYYGTNESTYWGQRYSPSKLSPFDGMSLNQVSIYARVAGTYTLFLYKDNTSNKLLEQQFSAQPGWNNVSFEAIPIDCSSDLWVIFHTTAKGPAIYGMYDEEDMDDAHYLFYDVNNLTPYQLQDDKISWPIKLNVTDGNFSYNIYRNNTEIETGYMSNSFIDHPTESGNYEYCVKTCANSWISEASTPASIDFSTMHTISEAVTIGHDLVLSASNQYDITSTGILTVTGTLSNDNAANLIIENGAQLVHNTAGVKATVKKTIEKYTVEGDNENLSDGWYLLASPIGEVNPGNVTNMLENNYDLYSFDQNEELEWRNYKKNEGFNLEAGIGYLYANSVGTTLSFAGTLAATATATDLAYYENAEMKGFNLIGNPFACNATIDRDFYVMNADRNEVTIAESGRHVAPCEGIFVQATAKSETASFQKATSAKNNASNPSLDVVVKKDKATLDRVRVRLGDAQGIEKISIRKNSTKLYLPVDGHRFAVANINTGVVRGTDVARNISTREMPVNFKAAENGTYSIGIESNSLDLDYLHLIDNMTGADIDLLQQAKYNFTAKTTDYASRFRLVFASTGSANNDPAGSASDAPFAYVSNGEIHLVETQNFASLQIIDMTGRVILCRDAARHVSTNGMPAGVYVLRLINGDEVKTQKIVIE